MVKTQEANHGRSTRAQIKTGQPLPKRQHAYGHEREADKCGITCWNIARKWLRRSSGQWKHVRLLPPVLVCWAPLCQSAGCLCASLLLPPVPVCWAPLCIIGSSCCRGSRVKPLSHTCLTSFWLLGATGPQRMTVSAVVEGRAFLQQACLAHFKTACEATSLCLPARILGERPHSCSFYQLARKLTQHRDTCVQMFLRAQRLCQPGYHTPKTNYSLYNACNQLSCNLKLDARIEVPDCPHEDKGIVQIRLSCATK